VSHSEDLVIYFCISENTGKCSKCVFECISTGHKLVTIYDLYDSEMNSIKEFDAKIDDFRTRKLPSIQREIEKFTEEEKKRINQEFDDYHALIEQKRRQVLADLPSKIEAYFEFEQCHFPSSVEVWDDLLKDAKRFSKVKLIQATYFGGVVNDTMLTLEPSVFQTDENYKKFVIGKQLTTKTLFLRHNLVDMSKAPLLAEIPLNLTDSQNYKTIHYTTTPTKPKRMIKQPLKQYRLQFFSSFLSLSLPL